MDLHKKIEDTKGELARVEGELVQFRRVVDSLETRAVRLDSRLETLLGLLNEEGESEEPKES